MDAPAGAVARTAGRARPATGQRRRRRERKVRLVLPSRLTQRRLPPRQARRRTMRPHPPRGPNPAGRRVAAATVRISASTVRAASVNGNPLMARGTIGTIGARRPPIRIRLSRSSRRLRPNSRPTPRNGADVAVEHDGQRIDRWLWHARLVRTRAGAAALASSGHIRVNGARIRAPSRLVRPDDVITVALDRSVRVVRVRGFSDRRGPASVGTSLYEELT